MAVAATVTIEASPEHQPFTITAHLRSGISFDPPYGLDLAGLLATRQRLLDQADRAAQGRLVSHPLPDTAEEEIYDLTLPLARCTTGPDWHWAATCAIPTDSLPDPEPRTFYKTVDFSWAHRAASRPIPSHVNPSAGSSRDRMVPAPVLLAPAISWRAVGDPEAVLRLLSPVRYLGRRRAVGEGRVMRWEVRPATEADPGAWTHLDETGAIARPCPAECAVALALPPDAWRLGWYAIRPPSWHPSRLTELAMAATLEDW